MSKRMNRLKIKSKLYSPGVTMPYKLMGANMEESEGCCVSH